MIYPESWMQAYIDLAERLFPGRVQCIGLQGSYGRGEAAPDSDIDPVLILDALSPQDVLTYREGLLTLPEQEKICGFVSGREELLNWDEGDLFQFYHDTLSYRGDLAFVRSRLNADSPRKALHQGACALYHGCVHSFSHGQNRQVLFSFYKTAAFLLQAKYYLDGGVYVKKHRELARLLTGADKLLLERALALRERQPVDDSLYREYAGDLLKWASGVIRLYSGTIKEQE